MVHLRDTDQLLCASLDGTCSIVDAELRMFSQPLYLKGHLMAVHDARYSSEHKLIASASSDKRILLWNPYSGSCLGTLTGHTAGIMAVEFNDPDHQLVSWGMDRTLRLWSVRHHVCLQTIETTWAPRKLNDISMGCLFDPQTRRLVMGCYYPVSVRLRVVGKKEAS